LKLRGLITLCRAYFLYFFSYQQILHKEKRNLQFIFRTLLEWLQRSAKFKCAAFDDESAGARINRLPIVLE